MRAIFKPVLYILLLLLPCGSFAAVTHKSYGPTQVRKPDAERLQKFLTDKDFKYETDYRAKIGFWEALWKWLVRHLFSPLIKGHALTIWNIIEYTFAIVTIFLVAWYFIKADRGGLFSRGAKKLKVDIEGGEEDINLMDFEKLIGNAIENHQYRIAVRYLYLRLLKDLSDTNLINWKAEKTNRDYLDELRSTPFGTHFREVTLLFDYAWYGDVAVNENNFGQIKDIFSEFYIKLQTPA
ncbi:MAG TPA: DUF4129 domain-containing protein [Bacteroidia bacterium]|jgi:hypothetical protein|nr:DUF4129 domain-containing protein [Bacteroidia bacterium]